MEFEPETHTREDIEIQIRLAGLEMWHRTAYAKDEAEARETLAFFRNGDQVNSYKAVTVTYTETRTQKDW